MLARVWPRALAAASCAALLLTGVDLTLGFRDPARELGGDDGLGASLTVLGVMAWLAFLSLAPLVGAVSLARRWPRRRVLVLGVALTVAALVWIDRALLMARPGLVGAGLLVFGLGLFAWLGLLERARWRPWGAALGLLGAAGLGILNGRTFVGVNPDQHFALVLGAWAVALPASWVLAARIERDESVRGRRATGLVVVGTAALVLLGIRGSGVADDSQSARFFVRRLAPQSAAALRGLEPVLDLDGDGYGGGFGGGDCSPLDGTVFPGANELPGDGVDQNCMAGDPSQSEVEALAAALTGQASPATASTGMPAARLLLVTVDALRQDHSLSATRRRLTGRCRELAVAYAAAPSTTYAVHALMTGRYPSQGVYARIGRWNVPVPDPAPRVAALLATAGYATGAAVFHHRFDPRLGLVAGFDDVWTAQPRADVIQGDAATATLEQARAWIADHDAPTFSWVHLYDPHEPYLPREGRASPRERYAAEVRYTDARLVELLDAWPELDQTAIVLTGDHGEAFGEHGERTHGSSLFEEQVRVPLWICPPRGQPLPDDPGPASAVDVAPTLLALAGVVRPSGMGGRALLGAGPAPVFAETAGESAPMTMVVVWPYKLLHLPRSGLFLLFDLEHDPGERVNLAEREPERLAELQGVLDRWLAWRGPESESLRAP